jgi:hypothetical protein
LFTVPTLQPDCALPDDEREAAKKQAVPHFETYTRR